MDLKGYYRKIRELQETLDEFVLVKSLSTESGGRGGVLSEATCATAARMVTDGVAEIASAEEAKEYRLGTEKARKVEEERRQSSQIQFSVITDAELRSLTRGGRARKE
jgi:hypothetical protein